jgi:hypothetical protein
MLQIASYLIALVVKEEILDLKANFINIIKENEKALNECRCNFLLNITFKPINCKVRLKYNLFMQY